MVFQDISSDVKLNELHVKKSSAQLADRFFSFVIDYFVISPFVFFLLYATFSNGFNFWKTHPSAPENDLFMLILAVSFVFYFGVIQALFITYIGSTPGQYFLKIKMFFKDESVYPVFLKALLRQIGFWISFLFLGLPFLAILAKQDRRTFYDRISESEVISLKIEKEMLFGFEGELKYWQSFFSTVIVFVIFLFGIFIWKSYGWVVERSESFAVLNDKKFFCSELEEVELSERLPTAIALNLVGQLSDSCLNKEADFIFWGDKSDDYSLAYFAKYLTTDDLEKERRYLDKACDNKDVIKTDKGACALAQAFLNKNFESFYSSLTSHDILQVFLKYELSIALNKESDIRENFTKLSAYNSLKAVRKYQILEMLSDKKNQSRIPASVKDNNKQSDSKENSELVELIKGL